MIYTLAALLLSFLALCTSIGALIVARRTSGQSQLKRVNELSLRCSLQEENLETMSVAIRNLRSRLNMAKSRQEKPETTTPAAETSSTNGANGTAGVPTATSSDEEKARWKREMNLKIATGAIKMR